MYRWYKITLTNFMNLFTIKKIKIKKLFRTLGSAAAPNTPNAAITSGASTSVIIAVTSIAAAAAAAAAITSGTGAPITPDTVVTPGTIAGPSPAVMKMSPCCKKNY
ncbi:unnamed protein product [Cuscuta epithymum]|uniref:Uncharacterized protein n=1 Tax=Cuscuta epithymum TaxID=186058 RepID=A0AAV0D1R8_9ASTE|nr:unnamed protein product [Cuscuta epithymum]